MNEITDAAIIGGGPAGLTAAVYARRAGLSTAVFSSPEPGSQLLKTESIENYPGFPEPVSGYDLLDNMQKQASGAGAEIIEETVIEAELKKTPFSLKTDSGKNFMARTVIIATGAVPRSLGLDSEKKFAGKGVSSCAVCDGFFFRGKTVTVAGGGDTALGEALYLAKIAAKVYLVHRRNEFRGTESLQKRIHAVANIETIMNSVITEIDGGKKVESVAIKNNVTGETRMIKTDGVFIAAGQQPATGIVAGQLQLDYTGIISVDAQGRTSVPGVFAAGDVAEPVCRQAVTAAASGARAALAAADYLKTL